MVSEQPELTPTEKVSDTSTDSKDKSGNNGDICRICFCGVSTESLLAPCKCKGSLAKVHKTCLETWLGNQAIDQCEICKYHYMTARRPKGFHEWLMNSSTREDKQNLVGDMVALLLLTPLVGAIQFSHEGFPTYHYTIWKQWRSHNFHVNLLIKANVTSGDEPAAMGGDIDLEAPSAVVVEEPPEMDVVPATVPEELSDKPDSAAELPNSPSKESPPKSTSSTLIIYTSAV
ncbi:hypothetical protein HPB48_002707 [Haemaphysalis longicornis]|uniref:RING-CH-type domain-containing protein n=1 Tax=Haemaphysalis longicornis TaxID=44386 RepID=A0A9J6GQ11_HAELO|nr:hypothetical protein HPB48_002707 [Haemaphysalis longicornis]